MRLKHSMAMLLSLIRPRPMSSFCAQTCHAFLSGRRKMTAFHNIHALHRKSDVRRFGTKNSDGDEDAPQQVMEPMARLYTEWSLADDRLLFSNRKKPLPELAATLGRGLRGVESRLEKLTDVKSQAYARLFGGGQGDNQDEDPANEKLIPAREVLRRIQWDHALSESDFSVLHYDRVDDALVESPMDAPNTSVSGKETKLVLAIPEHRIEGIKYKEQVVWDKEKRIDRVFGSMGGKGQTIKDVIANYDDWKREKDAAEELRRQRHAEVLSNIQSILGEERYAMLMQLSSRLLESCEEERVSMKKQVELYVQSVLELFQDVRRDPSVSLEPSLVPNADYSALDAFSEWIALSQDSFIRPAILLELSTQMHKVGNRVVAVANSQNYVLPELNEDDLTETFIRGSGAGGQKVNKTSNCVVLVHGPTQLRVECQETRSLQQNRKIARKRLRLKLDEYLNGTQSKTSLKNTQAATKKAKAKARSKTRLKKKMETELSDQ